MAATKANATYTVTTLSLLTIGPNVMETLPGFHVVLPQLNAQSSKAFPVEKVSAAVYPDRRDPRAYG